MSQKRRTTTAKKVVPLIGSKESPQRRFATATLALDDIKEVKKHLGVTINDVVLAISAGAVRKLLLKYDGQAEEPDHAQETAERDEDGGRLGEEREHGQDRDGGHGQTDRHRPSHQP